MAETYDEREGSGQVLPQAPDSLVIQVVEFVRNGNETFHFRQGAQRDPDMAMELTGRLESKALNDVRLD